MPTQFMRAESMRAVRRMILPRLLAVAAVVSFIAVAIVVYSESGRITDEAVGRAIYGTTVFNLTAMPLLDQAEPDHKAFQRLLTIAVARSRDDETGNLVHASIETDAGKSMAEAAVPEPHRKEIQALAAQPLPDDFTRVFHRRLHIRGEPYIDIAAPLKNSAGIRVASLRLIIKIAPESLAAMWRRVRRSVIIAILIVVAVSATLYPVITRLMQRLTGVSDDLLESNLGTLEVLGSAIAKRDSDTDAHNYRATIYSVRLAEALNVPPGRIRDLIKGALLHDVGKIGVRDNILLKPTGLTPDEYSEMKRHVRYGVEIIGRSDWLKPAADVVGGHHEKFDGSGYDRALSGASIPENARIFTIADVFDALTSTRPYKPALSLDESLQILTRGRGTHFDPEMTDVFLAIAPQLYQQMLGRDPDETRQELQSIMSHYYREGAAALI
ncbi:MAG: HD-GYP domain-containing protein [Candidatus Sumerlaeia bacterium]